MAAPIGEKLKTKFNDLTRMKYVDQAKWFLNGFWEKGLKDDPEGIWKVGQKFIELDPKKKEGNELDEFWSHKFLESLGETLTVIQLREKLKKIDVDMNGKMALLEYLIFKFSKTVEDVVVAPQGDNSKELAIAQEKLNIAQAALDDVTKKLADVAQASSDMQAKEATLAEQQRQLQKDEDELRAAAAELKAQADAQAKKIADLEAKSKDASLSQVNRSKAAAEWASAKQEDPQPLTKARLTQDAKIRKVEKQRKTTEEAKEAATRAREELEKQKANLEKAENDARKKLAEAEEFLEAEKKKGGSANGALWWMSRELTEQKKFLPKSKGGIEKK